MGTLSVSVRGLPEGARAVVRVQGPRGYLERVTVERTRLLKGLVPGTYRLRVAHRSVGGAVYAPARTSMRVKVRARARLRVTYRLIDRGGDTPAYDEPDGGQPGAPSPATVDLDGDGTVGCADKELLLSDYGTSNPRSDLNGDATVDVADLSILMRAWNGPSDCGGAPAQPVGPVTGLKVTGRGPDSISLAWTNPAGLAEVVVRRAAGGTAPGSVSAGTAVGVPRTGAAATDSGLTSNSVYSYAVFARGADGQVSQAASVTASTTPTPAANGGNRLPAGSSLESGAWLQSPDGRYRLTNQADGNVVLRVAASGRVLWASGTDGKGKARLVMQRDGNLVLYAVGDGKVLWTSSTSGSGSHLDVQNDANLVVYTSAGAPWSSRTGNDRLVAKEALRGDQQITSANGQYRLIQQGDGNLVLYRGSTPLWASNTAGQPGNWSVMQDDGNLVVYSGSNAPRWATATDGRAGAWAVVQNDGNFVVYSAGGMALWASNTAPGGGGGSAGGYPDWDAVDCSAQFDKYSWCKGGWWLSARGFGYRNCTDYVAWRKGMVWSQIQAGQDGNAIAWKQGWITRGRAWGTTPRVGAVAWWGSSMGKWGHVAYVTAVNSDGSARVAQYNRHGDGRYTEETVRADAYLY